LDEKPPKTQEVKVKLDKREKSLEWLYKPVSWSKFINKLDIISFGATAWTIFFFFYEKNSLCRYLVVWSMVITPTYLINCKNIGWLLVVIILVTLTDYIINTIDSSSSNWIYDTTWSRFSAFPTSFMVEIHSTITEMLGL
jgi:hypothetical protein